MLYDDVYDEMCMCERVHVTQRKTMEGRVNNSMREDVRGSMARWEETMMASKSCMQRS